MNTAVGDRIIRATEFWYALDNATLWHQTPEVKAALGEAYGTFRTSFDGPVDAFRASFVNTTHPGPFVAAVAPGRSGFLALADFQIRLVRSHFGDDFEAVRQAFEDFGQGVLYDPRPPRRAGSLVHQMDGTPDTWVGYHRWHASLRAAMLLGADDPLLEHLVRCVALAWAVQTEADPRPDRPDNPGLPAARLAELAARWMEAPLPEVDRAFAFFRTRAPAGGDAPAPPIPTPGPAPLPAATRYGKVQALLDAVAGESRPSHQGFERFWRLPLREFLAIGGIYGVTLVVPGDGAGSGLIQALKGEPPFGPDGMPRMPMNRPPMAAADIAFIEAWIDDGCPDDPLIA